MLKIPLYTIYLGSILLLIQACGYQFSAVKSLPGDIHSISVSVLRNETRQSGMEVTMTNALVDQFNRHSPAMVVPETQAQAVLTGTVRSLVSDVISRTSTRQVSERRLTVTVSLTLRDKANQILWQGQELSAQQTYSVAADDIITERNRLYALQRMAQRIAEEAYLLMTQAF